MGQTSNYGEILKHEGLKNTKHRNSIMEVIGDSDCPLTAEQIFLELKEKKVSINLSTVYRILDTLVDKNVIVKSTINGENKALFEINNNEHKHHLICSDCKKMVSVGDCPLEDYEKLLQDKLGFDVKGHKLEIYGICKECRQLK